MNNLKQILSPLQISEINDCLEKLFVFQDKPISDNKKAILVTELLDMGFPFLAIVQGLKDLYQADLRNLKLAVIVDSIRKRIDVEAGLVECPYCLRGGAVLLLDIETRFQYALACKCSNGDITQKFQKLVRWNGLNEQLSNGKKLCASQLRQA